MIDDEQRRLESEYEGYRILQADTLIAYLKQRITELEDKLANAHNITGLGASGENDDQR